MNCNARMVFSIMHRMFLSIGDVGTDGWRQVCRSCSRCLPKKHKDRARILEGYQKMMKSLKEYQNADGLWNQLIDKSDCWTESSGSAMFTFAFIMGVKNGWLDAEEYAPAARKAWLALFHTLMKRTR